MLYVFATEPAPQIATSCFVFSVVMEGQIFVGFDIKP
jgi:hypothetical protein